MPPLPGGGGTTREGLAGSLDTEFPRRPTLRRTGRAGGAASSGSLSTAFPAVDIGVFGSGRRCGGVGKGLLEGVSRLPEDPCATTPSSVFSDRSDDRAEDGSSSESLRTRVEAGLGIVVGFARMSESM